MLQLNGGGGGKEQAKHPKSVANFINNLQS